MTVLNRLLALLLLLVVIAAALVTLGLVTGALTVAEVRQVWPYAPVRGIARDVAHLSTQVYRGQRVGAYVVGGAVVVGLLALWGLVRDVTPPPRRARTLVLRGDAPGYTEVSYKTLDELAAYSVHDVSGVERLRARVEPRCGGLDVRCRALVSPFIDLAQAGPQLERTVAEHLERVTGLPVRTVRVRTVVQEERAHRTVRN